MKKTSKEAVNQPNPTQLSILTALVGKETASFLVPDYNEGRQLSIVDDSVLKYLTELLPKADVRTIINNLRDMLYDIANKNVNEDRLAQAVAACGEFVAFHESVNLIKRYFDASVTVTREKPFNLKPDDLTYEELLEMRNKAVDSLHALDQTIFDHPNHMKDEVKEPTNEELMEMEHTLQGELDEVKKQIRERMDEVEVVRAENRDMMP